MAAALPGRSRAKRAGSERLSAPDAREVLGVDRPLAARVSAGGQARALLAALDDTDYGARCAHGRPVVAEWAGPEIEKRFGRDYESYAHAAAPESL
jgi:hypothetical protein